MKTTDFAKMLELGLGRAVLYTQQHDMSVYREVILNACLHCQSYDPHMEGTRAVHVFDIIHQTPDVAFYRDRILTRLAALSDEDGWDVGHVYHLAGLFAEQGDLQAKQAMYDKFDNEPDLEGYTGADQLVRTLNAEGLRFVAAWMGKDLAINREHIWATDLFYQLQQQVGEDSASTVRRKLLADPTTRDFAELIADEEPNFHIEHGRPLNYEEIKMKIEQGRPLPIINGHLWGKSASVDDLLNAAYDLLKQTDLVRLKSYLYLFGDRSFPLDPALLFPYTRHESECVRLAAWRALGVIRHPAVRQLGLEKMQDPEIRWRARGMLIANYEPGDWALFEAISADQRQNPKERYSLGLTIRQLFEAHPLVEAEGSFLNMYETDPCGHCRGEFVRNLYTLGKLPDWMRDECRYDSYSDTREFIAGLDRAEQPKL